MSDVYNPKWSASAALSEASCVGWYLSLNKYVRQSTQTGAVKLQGPSAFNVPYPQHAESTTSNAMPIWKKKKLSTFSCYKIVDE